MLRLYILISFAFIIKGSLFYKIGSWVRLALPLKLSKLCLLYYINHYSARTT